MWSGVIRSDHRERKIESEPSLPHWTFDGLVVAAKARLTFSAGVLRSGHREKKIETEPFVPY
jgi:hypothetical protein